MTAQIIIYGGGGGTESGPSGALIVLLILVTLFGVPAVVGLALRRRDARRGTDRHDADPEPKLPPGSSELWYQYDHMRLSDESTRGQWIVIGVLAAALLVYFLASQI